MAVNMHGVRLSDKRAELADVDRQIAEIATRGRELALSGAKVSELYTQMDIMRHLYHRKDSLLHELKKAGVTERELYARKVDLDALA